jgi:hypothetical protein
MKKIQRPHRKSNPWPSDSCRSASTKCAMACPYEYQKQIQLTPRRKPEITQDSGCQNNAKVTVLPTQLNAAVWSIHMKIVNIVTVHNCTIVGFTHARTHARTHTHSLARARVHTHTHDHNCDMRLSLWSLMPSVFNIPVPTLQRKRLHFIRRSIGLGMPPEPVRRPFD